MQAPEQPKRRGAPPKAGVTRTGRLPIRVLAEVEAKARRIGRDAVEAAIMAAPEPAVAKSPR